MAVVVEGRAGVDPLPHVLDVTAGARRAVYESPGLTDDENLAAFLDVLPEDTWDDRIRSADSWETAFDALFSTSPVSLVIHRPSSLARANRRFWGQLGASWVRIRKSGARAHLYLVEDQRGLAPALRREESPLRDPAEALRPGPAPDPVEALSIPLASHYDLAEKVRHWTGLDLLTGWCLLGGNPENWATASSNGSPGQAARVLFFRGIRGSTDPYRTLERYVQTPHRYASLLAAIAEGPVTRREAARNVRRASTTRSAAGPYLQRLIELGLVSVERPLGAPAGGRHSRYRVTDPSEAFWWAHVHELGSTTAAGGDPTTLWKRRLRPQLHRHVVAHLPQILQSFLWRASEAHFGAPPRELGPLWGEGYDFPVAATLQNGAVCYSRVHPGPGPADVDVLSRLEGEMREVRYGFGRQARLRLIVSVTGFTEALRREEARSTMVRLLGPEELTRSPTTPPD